MQADPMYINTAVTSVLDDGRLVGVVRVEDVLARYRSEIRRREMEADVLGDKPVTTESGRA